MRKLKVFNGVSIDGYIADPSGDMTWAHNADPEWDEFATSQATGGSTLVFGRTTYDLMVKFWPTPEAAAQAPEIARVMNESPKIVFSRTMTRATWNNTRVVSGDIVGEVRKLKAESDRDMVIMGSGQIIAQLAGLVDSFMIFVNPIALGGGKGMFTGIPNRLPLKLESSRAFKNGNVVLSYTPRR
jgi:dihydrofolate reductase